MKTRIATLLMIFLISTLSFNLMAQGWLKTNTGDVILQTATGKVGMGALPVEKLSILSHSGTPTLGLYGSGITDAYIKLYSSAGVKIWQLWAAPNLFYFGNGKDTSLQGSASALLVGQLGTVNLLSINGNVTARTVEVKTNLIVDGTSTLTGTVTHTGNTVLTGTTRHTGKVTTTGNDSIHGYLVVDGASTLTGACSITGALTAISTVSLGTSPHIMIMDQSLTDTTAHSGNVIGKVVYKASDSTFYICKRRGVSANSTRCWYSW